MPFQCLNCPSKPDFYSMQQLEDHWAKTHTVPMIENIPDPWGERPPKVVKRYVETPVAVLP